MYCWNCGMDNPEGSKVCVACGNPLSVDDIDLLLNLSTQQQTTAASSGASGNASGAAGAASEPEDYGQVIYPAYNDHTGGYDPILTNQYVQEILQKIGVNETVTAEHQPEAGEQTAAPVQQNVSSAGGPAAEKKAAQASGNPVRRPAQSAQTARQKKQGRQERSETVQRAMQKQAPKMSSAEAVAYDAEETEEQTAPERGAKHRRKKHSALRSVIVVLLILLLLAGAALALYLLKTDTITSISAETVSAASIEVNVSSMYSSELKVVATAPDGTTLEAPVVNKQAVFDNLSADTEYSFMAESAEGKLLLGNRAAAARTTDLTHLNGFDVLSVTSTTAELSLYGTGTPPEAWVITLTAPDGSSQTFEETDTQFTLENLTPGTAYEAVVTRNDGDLLDGVTACSFSTLEYTVLETFAETDMTTDSISLQWSSTGTEPENWTLTWDGTDGSSESQVLEGGSIEATLEGLKSGITYTITISCDSMKESENSTLILTIPSVTVSNVQAAADEDGSMQVTWDYTADFDPTNWVVSCSYDNDLVPVTVSSKTNKATVDGLLPETEYTITVTTADGLPVSEVGASAVCTTPEAENYTDYGCSDAEMTLYITEDNKDSLSVAADTFTTSQHISFAVSASYEKTSAEKSAETTYIVRSQYGLPIAVYQSTRTWDGDWVKARHTGELPDCIEEPGSYTLEIYFDGKFLASADFTVVSG